MMGQRAYCDRDHPGSDAEADWWCETYHRPEMPKPLGFRWFPGIPSRDLTTRATQGDVPIRVTFLTMLGFVRIEELGTDGMPVRTLAQIDVYGKGFGLPEIETLIRDLGVTP